MQSTMFLKTKMPTVIQKVLLLLTALTMGTVAMAAFSAKANAGTSVLYNQASRYASTKLYYAPTTRVNVKYSALNGSREAKFIMKCWASGQAITGNYWSDKWFWGQDFVTGGYSYVHSSYVYYQTWVPRC